jgi:hypothetical protein
MTFPTFKVMLYLSLFSGGMFIHESNASKTTSNNPTIVYHEHLPFTDAYKNQDPKTAVSAAKLLLINSLSTRIETQFLPSARLLTKLEENNGTSICALFKLKTAERVSQYDFSLPISFMQTHRLFVRKGIGALPPTLLNAQGEIKEISDLFDTYLDAKIILWDKISQGELIDKSIKNIPEKNKFVIQSPTEYAHLAKMINRSRADFAILYSAAVTEFENEFYPLGLLSYRIEGVEPISSVHIMCNKNKASSRFLATVNEAIIELYKTPQFVSANILNVSPNEVPLIIDAIEKIKLKTIE